MANLTVQDWENYVLRLGLEVKTDADIATDIANLTITNISTKEARRYLREQKLWFETSTGFKGRVQKWLDGDYAPGPNTPTAQELEEVDQLFAEWFGGGQLDVLEIADDVAFGDWIKRALRIFVQNNLDSDALPVMTSQQRNQFFQLGGGRPFFNVTEAEVAAGRAAYQAIVDAEAIKQPLRELAANNYNDAIDGVEAGTITDATQLRAVLSQ